MTPRRFLPRRRPWRYALAFVAAVAALRWVWDYQQQGQVHPIVAAIAPGQYVVKQVRDDGVLEVFIDTENSPARWIAVRLLGIQTVADAESVAQIRELVGQGPVRLRFDRRRLDEDSNLLAYVFVAERFVNVELVRQGLVREATHQSDSGPIVRQLKQAESEARSHRRGIWRDPN